MATATILGVQSLRPTLLDVVRFCTGRKACGTAATGGSASGDTHTCSTEARHERPDALKFMREMHRAQSPDDDPDDEDLDEEDEEIDEDDEDDEDEEVWQVRLT